MYEKCDFIYYNFIYNKNTLLHHKICDGCDMNVSSTKHPVTCCSCKICFEMPIHKPCCKCPGHE